MTTDPKPTPWLTTITPFLGLPQVLLLALMAWGEARGEGKEGMKAVMNVVGNRVKKGGWFVDKEIADLTQSKWHGVILKRYQFSCFLPADPNFLRLRIIAGDFVGYIAAGRMDGVALGVAADLAMAMLHGTLEDNTNGATHYYEKHLRVPPMWATAPGYTQVATIGNHLFYKEG